MKDRHMFPGSHHGEADRRPAAGAPERPGRRGPRGERPDLPFGRGAGRLFGRGELRSVLLALIAEEPRHGYELIRVLEETTGGAYVPSPGAIYPTLTLLEEEDLIAAETSDSHKKRYAITDVGRQWLADNAAIVAEVQGTLHMAARMAARMTVPGPVMEAARQIKGALITHAQTWDDAEVARVVGILQRTLSDIDGEQP